MDDIILPQYISRLAFYSAQSIIIVSVLVYYLNYYRLCLLLGCLYFTTLIHWNCVKRISVIKIIDILLAITTIISVTLFDCYRFQQKYIILWRYSISTSIIIFIINESLFAFSIMNTRPNTREREIVYYRSTYIHMIFLHLLPTSTCAICAILSL